MKDLINRLALAVIRCNSGHKTPICGFRLPDDLVVRGDNMVHFCVPSFDGNGKCDGVKVVILKQTGISFDDVDTFKITVFDDQFDAQVDSLRAFVAAHR